MRYFEGTKDPFSEEVIKRMRARRKPDSSNADKLVEIKSKGYSDVQGILDQMEYQFGK